MSDHQLVELFRPGMGFSRRYLAVCACGEEVWFDNETRPRYVGDSKGLYHDAERAVARHEQEVHA